MRSCRIVAIILIYSCIFFNVPSTALAEIAPVSFKLAIDYAAFLDSEFLYADIIIDAGNQSTNAVSIDLNYSIDKLSLHSVEYNQAFCSIIAFENFDNSRGDYRLVCGNPDAITDSHSIATLKFVKLDAGWAKFSFNNALARANDGQGTSLPVQTEIHRINIVK